MYSLYQFLLSQSHHFPKNLQLRVNILHSAIGRDSAMYNTPFHPWQTRHVAPSLSTWPKHRRASCDRIRIASRIETVTPLPFVVRFSRGWLSTPQPREERCDQRQGNASHTHVEYSRWTPQEQRTLVGIQVDYV
jgi:hypothetical protein